MTCPVCGGKTKVVGNKSDCESIHRKRKCDECGYMFFTVEVEVESHEEYNKLTQQYLRERKRHKADSHV